MKKIAFWAICALFAASIANSPCVRAQTFDRTFAQSLILAGGGTNITNALTITVNAMLAPSKLVFPGANVAGLLINNGTGTLSWSDTLPSGLTLPSPIINNATIFNPTFTGTVVLPAGTVIAASLGLANQNIFVGNTSGDATAVAPTANAVLITDATSPVGTPQWAKTLPSNLTIPSPTISNPSISNPIFTGSPTFTAASIPVADLAASTIGITSTASTMTVTGSPITLGNSGNVDLNLAHANTWTAAITDSLGGIGTTQTNGFKAVNAAPATATVKVQQSPSYEAGAHVWGNGADSTMAWHFTNIPTSATVPTSILRFDEGNGGAGYTPQMSISNTGTLTLGNANGSTGVTGSLALANSGNSNLTTITVPSAAPSVTYTLPATAPAAGQVLAATTYSAPNATLGWTNLASAGSAGSFFTGNSGDPALPAAGTKYWFPLGEMSKNGANAAADVADETATIVNESGTIKNLTGLVSTAPGGSNSLTFTVYSNHGGSWASTGVTTTITGSATTNSDNTHTFTVSAGDEISMQISDNYSPASTVQGSWAFAGPNAGTTTGVTNPMTTTGDIIYSSDNSGDPARLGVGNVGQFLGVASGLPSWTNALTQNGIGTTYTNGLILQNTTASTLGTTVQQSPSLSLVSHAWSTTATAADSTRIFTETVVPTSSANPIVSNLTFQSGSKASDMVTNMTLSNAGVLNLPALTASTSTVSQVVMTDANSNLITSSSATTVPPHTFLLGPISGSSNGAATFRAIDSSDISASAATNIAAKLAATNSSGVAQLIQNVSATPLTNSTTNLANVTGMSFSIGSNDTMSFQFFVMDTCTYTGTAPTGSPGIQFALTFPTNGTTIYAMFNGTYDNNANGHEHPERIENSGVKSTTVYSELGGMPGGFPLGIMSVYGTIITGASDAGTVQLQFCCSATGYTAEIFPLGTGYAYTH